MNWIIWLVIGIVIGTLFGAFLFSWFSENFIEGIMMIKDVNLTK